MARIAFIGIGNMGHPMLCNLLSAGHEVRAYDLSEQALARAVEAGASAASGLADAVANAEVVITMLPEGRHVRAAYIGESGANDGILGYAPVEALLLDCSTIDVATARDVAARAAEDGYEMIDAPVSGGVGGAEAGTLTFMVGGPDSAFARAKPVLEVMGANLVHMGPAGLGQAAKICNNMMAGITMVATAEVACLGEALGLDPKKLYDVVSTSSGKCFMFDKSFPVAGVVEGAPCNNEFAPGFKAALMAKDLGLAEAAAKETGTSNALGAAAAAFYRLTCTNGDADLDCSAVFRLLHGDR